jgi:methylornithine synthase
MEASMTGRTSTGPSIENICERALEGTPPGLAELETLLGIGTMEEAEPLFAAARELRRRYFGDAIFLSGFVYHSTYCRNACTFCLYRKGDKEAPRYRMSLDDILTACRGLADSGVHLLDITSGEDPLTHDAGKYEWYSEIIAAVKAETGKAIMISPGVVPADTMKSLKEAGADIYACYQETHTRELFDRRRMGQDYDVRWAARVNAKRAGMLVEDGCLTGMDETLADRANSVLTMGRNMDLDMARNMTFVPQPGSPMADHAPNTNFNELLITAALRLMRPGWMTTASLDCESLAGMEPRVNAGASVVTSLIYPESGIRGVANAELDVEERLRTVPPVTEKLHGMGLRVGTDDEYRAWIERSHAEYAAREGALA